MSEEEQKTLREDDEPIAFSEFLESVPPGSFTEVSDPTTAKPSPGPHGAITTYEVNTPEIQLHCSGDACNGLRFFRCNEATTQYLSSSALQYFYMRYTCSNCRQTEKVFSLAGKRHPDSPAGRCYKLGEFPEYGPPTPPRLISLIGPDRNLFLKGRRCENQGLGIGAFAYYRRVIEGQRERIFDQIIKVSRRVEAPADLIAKLEVAKAETQFSRALEDAKEAIPQVLLINGQNPLTLLHSALSDGLHSRTDEECLELATSVRVVLAELSECLARALKDDAELKKALARLAAKKA